MLKINDKVVLVSCSNPQSINNKEKINKLIDILKDIGLDVLENEFLFEDNYLNGKERAKLLNEFYGDEDVKAIFDISGGDIANEVLEYLDYEKIKKSKKLFFGYSDLTTVINAIYNKTENCCYLYQIRNILSEDYKEQIKNFENFIIKDEEELLKFKYEFVKGDNMSGIVVGGNIRCLLKLSGTQYMPNFENKILLLEAMSGEVFQMKTYLNQLKQIGAFSKLNGIILGTFTKMEQNKIKPSIEKLVLDIIDDKDLPIIKTKDIGHGHNSKCIVIGKYHNFKK